ncbi:hypothetical protein SCHPADRAFT_944939 [Schizopora paradoxa]|uniref:Uncharacterized protein n=1 Tax=Schizopora paradoxa TaxID=27342 RepID=A0A0H2R7H7_9AGAM|nr:hypothetical protein SCHPADRAFT_944939 [Schizopora paradoxa]
MASKRAGLKSRSNAKTSPNKSRATPDLEEKSSPSTNVRDSGSKVSLRGNNAAYQELLEENEALKTTLSQSESTKERYLKHISRQEIQLAGLEEARRHAEGEASALRERLDAYGMDTRRLREERDEARRQCEAFREEVQTQKNLVSMTRSEVEARTREMRMAEGERREALEKCERVTEELRRMNERLMQAEDEQALPKVDGAALASGFNNSSGLREVGGAAASMDAGMGMLVLGGPSARTHEVAGNEMIHMLTGLNRLILDIASSAIKIPSGFRMSAASQVSLNTPISDLKGNFNHTTNATGSNARPNSWIADVLHPALVKHLAGPSRTSSTDTAWGMLAIGTVLQHSVARYVDAWPVSPAFETASSLGKEFLAAYDTLRREEPQPNVALWRTMGLKYIRPLNIMNKNLHLEMVSGTIGAIADVLSLSVLASPQNSQSDSSTGMTGSDSDREKLKHTSYTSDFSQEALLDHLRTSSGLLDKVRMLWVRATEFAERMKEHASTGGVEYRVLYVRPGTPFEAKGMRTLWEQPTATTATSSPAGVNLNVGNRGGPGLMNTRPGERERLRIAKVFCAPELGLEVNVLGPGGSEKTSNVHASVVLVKAGVVCCEPRP